MVALQSLGPECNFMPAHVFVSGCSCFDYVSARPSAALDRVSSAQRGAARPLGRQERCTEQHVIIYDSEKDKEQAERRVQWRGGLTAADVKRCGRTGGEVGKWSERKGGGRRSRRGFRNEI